MTLPKTLKMQNGVEMPIFGLGTWQSSKEEVIKAVRAAVQDGYRLIDTAACYQNEDAIGEALTALFAEGVVKREDLFVTTKCWCDSLAPEHQEAALRDSLKKLQLEYVDLYLAHMPGAFTAEMAEQRGDVTVEQLWAGFETLYEKKLARAIGVSNFSAEQIERVMKVAKVPIHNHQVELHLYLQQKELQEQCKRHGITLTAYAPLGSPGRVHFVLPNGYKPEWPAAPSPLEDQEVLKIAARHNKTPAQVLLRHLMQCGIAVIPKSTNENRIRENHALCDFELSSEEVARLNQAPQQPRMFWQDFLIGHPEDPFRSERN